METIIIVVHLMVVLALVGVVLIQRSEGGGLGIGGGSGFMTARGATNALTRTTAILAIAFFATSLGLSILARYGEQPGDILDRVQTAPATGGAGVLDQLGDGKTQQPAPSQTPPSGSAETITPPAAGTAAPPAGEGSVTPPASAPAAQPSAPPAIATTPPGGTDSSAAPSGGSAAPANPQVPSGQ